MVQCLLQFQEYYHLVILKAKSIITVDHVTITEQNNSGSVVNSTRSESIESDLSASSPVTKQLEAVDGGLKFVKGTTLI